MENPFGPQEEETVDWYPDDSTRKFVSQAIEQLDTPRTILATRPQVCKVPTDFACDILSLYVNSNLVLNILFTAPDHRRRGVATMLLDWGLATAKDLGLEFWLNATPIGKPLYEKHGFEVVQKIVLAPKCHHPDEKWKRMEKEIGEVTFYTMWLPKEGLITENTIRAWAG